LLRVSESYQESRLNEFRDRGVLKGAEYAAAERSKTNEQLTTAERVLRNIIKKVEKAGPFGIKDTDLVQAVHSRDRPLARGALDYALGQGLLVMDEETKFWTRP
jgi:hypothetical protein